MPRYGRRRFARKPKRTYRKRNSRFRYRFSRKRGMTSMKSRVTVAPDTAYTKLKFYDSLYRNSAMAPNAVLTSNYDSGRIIRGNDLYDPLSNSGTNQPTGFDQWCSQTGLYNQFVVHGCKIRYEFINLSATAALDISVYPVMESNATVTTISGPNQPYVTNALCGTGNGQNKVVIKKFMKTKKMIGIRDLSDFEGIRGRYNGSPASPVNYIWNWASDVAPVGSDISSPSYIVKRELTYYVQFLTRPIVEISTNAVTP